MAKNKRLKQLRDIDWTFKEYSSNGHITGLHPYPARFIPKIPKTIIEHLKLPKKTTILDPFAGCGTALYEGLEAGHNVVGIDVNPLAVLLQRVYTYCFSKDELRKFKDLTQKLNNAFSKCKDSVIDDFLNIPNVNHWFSNEAQSALSCSLVVLNNSNLNEELKDLARFSISRVVVRISNQQSNTQYRAVGKNLKREDIRKIIIASFNEVFDALSIIEREWKGKSEIIQGDAREASSYDGVKGVNLIITSPPYPNAYEYWLYHKYRMYWLNMDPLWCRSREIGARPFYSGSGKLDETDFQKDMEQVLQQLHKVTAENALQFWVVGDSIIKGRLVDNTRIITNACDKTGWQILEIINRDLVRSRSSFQGIGRQKKEDIIVISK